MSRDPSYAENGPAYMMADAEMEAEEAAAAAGYPKPLVGPHLEILRAARLARARENVAAGRGSIFDYVALGAAENPAGAVHDINEHPLAYRAAMEPAGDEGETP